MTLFITALELNLEKMIASWELHTDYRPDATPVLDPDNYNWGEGIVVFDARNGHIRWFPSA